MKFRFSLGGLLLAVTLLGAACFWRSRPRSVAEEFVKLIGKRQYAEADAMFQRKEDAFLVEFVERDARNLVQTATVTDQSIGQWLSGDCEVELALIDGAGLGALLMLTVPVNASGPGQYRYSGGRSGMTGFFDEHTPDFR